jgi:hypothetical protein
MSSGFHNVTEVSDILDAGSHSDMLWYVQTLIWELYSHKALYSISSNCGWSQSALSANAIYSPLAMSNPKLYADETPPFS